MHATYLDAAGKEQTVIMGCYGIGTSRLVQCVIEANHDERGIIWPRSVAPYDVHVVGLNLDRGEVASRAEALVQSLEEGGLSVLYDDRADVTAGVKFNDADLLGMPLRLTVSPRGLKDGAIELKLRRGTAERSEVVASPERIPRETVVAVVQERLAALRGELPGPPKADLQ